LGQLAGCRDIRTLDTTGEVILGIFIGLIAAAIIIPNLLAGIECLAIETSASLASRRPLI